MHSTENIWNNIILDFRQPISYLLPAIIITMAGMLIYKIYKKEKAELPIVLIILLFYESFFLRLFQRLSLRLIVSCTAVLICHKALFLQYIFRYSE